MDVIRCDAITRGGKPCTGRALPGDTRCFSHSARLREAREAGNRQGGTNSAKAIRLTRGLPPELADVPGRVRALMERAEEGKIYARDAEAFCTLGRLLLDCMKWSAEMGVVRDLEARLNAAEAQLADLSPADAVRFKRRTGTYAR